MDIKEIITPAVLEEYFRNELWLKQRFAIYEEFIKEGSNRSELTDLIRRTYGIGGSSPAIEDYNESHDGKGISFYKHQMPDKLTLTWSEVTAIYEKLLSEGRFLSEEELAQYPEYLQEKEDSAKRGEIVKKYRELYHEFNSFAYENHKITLDYEYMEVTTDFFNKTKKLFCRSKCGRGPVYVLPKMREAVNLIRDNAPHLTDKANEVLKLLSSDVTAPFELTVKEMAEYQEGLRYKPQYVITEGDTVYIDSKACGIITIDENEVTYFDTEFPIMDMMMPRKEFDLAVSRNCRNNVFLQYVKEVS